MPCFNEEESLAYLGNALDALSSRLGRRGSLSFVLVDDGSTDGTWREMERLFGADPRFRLVRHDRNRGVGAAILTGVAAAETEAVAVIDSDCSYDPARIEEMLPLLGPDMALVTASPYHALGGVEGVPQWRLVLSRGASRLYRLDPQQQAGDLYELLQDLSPERARRAPASPRGLHRRRRDAGAPRSRGLADRGTPGGAGVAHVRAVKTQDNQSDRRTSSASLRNRHRTCRGGPPAASRSRPNK